MGPHWQYGTEKEILKKELNSISKEVKPHVTYENYQAKGSPLFRRILGMATHIHIDRILLFRCFDT